MASPFHLTSDNKVATRAQAKAFAKIVISGVTVATGPGTGLTTDCDQCGAYSSSTPWGMTATIPFVGPGLGGDCSYEGLGDPSPLVMHDYNVGGGTFATQARLMLNVRGANLRVEIESNDPIFIFPGACYTHRGVQVFEGSYSECIGGESTVNDLNPACVINSVCGHGGTATVSFCD